MFHVQSRTDRFSKGTVTCVDAINKALSFGHGFVYQKVETYLFRVSMPTRPSMKCLLPLDLLSLYIMLLEVPMSSVFHVTTQISSIRK